MVDVKNVKNTQNKMKRLVHKKLEGYIPYNKCMPTDIERFFSGSHDTYKKGMPENNKELCEEYIKEHHPRAKIDCIKATLYYEIPESTNLCNQSAKCGENVCYCDDLMKSALKDKPTV